MPYITKEAREALEATDLEVTNPITELSDEINEPGELNYVISRLCDDYITDHGKSYKTINDIIGVLECAKLELYRRVAAPYEDGKRHTNGDVYTHAG